MSSGGGAVIATPEDVAQLYTTCARSLQRLVAGGVRASDVVVEDACQVAWSRLVRDGDRVRRESAFGWLVRTAIHEAYRLARRERRDLSLEVLVELEEGGEWEAILGSDPTDALTAHVARVQSLRALPPRQQRLVWLRGCGLSYAEIANATGDSERTVERQLVRAQRRLSALGAG
jgi:RNA polymerase sigma factor (sigma-70 family)